MKMGGGGVARRLRIDSDMRPPRVRQLPDRWPILIATTAMLFMGQDTGSGVRSTGRDEDGNEAPKTPRLTVCTTRLF